MRSLFVILFLLSANLVGGPALAQEGVFVSNEQDGVLVANETAAPDNAAVPQAAVPPQANQSGADAGDPEAPQVITESGKALIVLFVLAAILESALAWFFNLGFVAAFFNGRNIKPIISGVFALAVTFGFQSVLLIGLFANYGYDTAGADAHFLCRLIESLVLAGGSAGVNRLLRNLGIRPVDPIAERNPVPQPLDAWIAVEHRRIDANGPVDVEIGTAGEGGATSWMIAGQITGAKPLTGFAKWLLRDRSRFPASGGYVVTPGVPISVRLAWTKADGTIVHSPVWGPNALADRAIVDIDLTL